MEGEVLGLSWVQFAVCAGQIMATAKHPDAVKRVSLMGEILAVGIGDDQGRVQDTMGDAPGRQLAFT